jgi:hypothetical protein
MEIMPGINGNTAFTIGNIGTASGLKLLIGAGKNVKCYSLPQ